MDLKTDKWLCGPSCLRSDTARQTRVMGSSLNVRLSFWFICFVQMETSLQEDPVIYQQYFTKLEETIIKEIEQNQLTWYGHVQRMAEGRLPKITLMWMPKQKRARGRPKKNWMEGIRKAMNERNLNEGKWEDGKQ